MKLALKSSNEFFADIAVSGTVTQSDVSPTAEPLQRLLGISAFDRGVLLDLSRAEFIDSSGVNWLLNVHRRTGEAGGKLVLYAVAPIVDSVLKVLRMHQVFEMAATQEEARQRIQGDIA
jgi:anti-anti-sigma factor